MQKLYVQLEQTPSLPTQTQQPINQNRMPTHSIPLQQLAIANTQNTRLQAQNTMAEFGAQSTATAYEHPVTDNTEEDLKNKTAKSATPIEDTEEETMITSSVQDQIRILEQRLAHYFMLAFLWRLLL
jgi:hypothetical protein